MEMPCVLSDEEYLINCAITAQEVDSYSAKSWLLTAKTMFPKSSRIQFEGYNIQKRIENIKEASECLLQLYKEFKSSEELWSEVKKIWKALNTDRLDNESRLLRKIFENIPRDMQQHILLYAAENSKDILEQCSIIFLVLRLFPRCIRQHGIPLIEMFVAAESRLHPHDPLNVFRTSLICDVLPLLLKSTSLAMPAEQLYQLLLKGLEYYIIVLIRPANESPKLNLSEHDKSWNDLFELTHAFGKLLKWDLQDIFTSGSNIDSQWQRINNLFVYCKDSHDKSLIHALQPQVMICCLILFVYCLYKYSLVSNPSWFAGNNSCVNPTLIFIEDNLPYSQQKSLKPLLDQSWDTPLPIVTPLIKTKDANTFNQNFMIASKCYNLLISDNLLQAEFLQIQRTLKMEFWPWYYAFQTDALIFQKKYNIAYNKLSLMQNFNTQGENKMNIKLNLQMASCLYFIADYKGCFAKISEVVPKLSSVESSDIVSKTKHSLPSSLTRYIRVISLVKEEVLKYCISLVLSSLKQLLAKSLPHDTALGHMIVLMQYDWPNNENDFLKVLDIIKQQSCFTYNIFFNYVTNIDILEEFAYIGNNAHRGLVNLDFLPSNVQHTKQRTITRGVNKEVKEDFRQALEKQFVSEHDGLDTIISSFLINEKESILSCFSQ